MRVVWVAFLLLSAASLSFNVQAADRYVVRGQAVDGLTGQPLPNMRIVIRNAEDRRRAADPVISGADGRFAFSGLGPGEYVAETWLHGELIHYGETAAGTMSTVRTGPGVNESEFIFRVLPHPSIDGFVRDQFGNPIQYARVDAIRGAWVNGSVIFGHTSANYAVTDGGGRYHLSALAPGAYRICAQLLGMYGGPTDVIAPTSSEFDFASDEPHYYRSSCHPGNDRGYLGIGWAPVHQDFELAATPLSALAATKVRGRITNPIVVRDLNGREIGGYLGLQWDDGAIWPSAASVNPDGTFELSLNPGRYVLITSNVSIQDIQNRSASSLVARRILEIDGTPVNDLGLTLQPLAAISVFLDNSGTPVPQAGAVSIGLRDVSSAQSREIWAIRANDGSLKFPPLDPGTYWLLTRTAAPFCIDSATIGGRSVLHGSITVSPGDAESINVALSTRCASIGGKVILPEGVSDHLTVAILMSGTADSPGDMISIYSGTDGSFSIEQLPPGSYRIWAWSQSDPGFPGPASLAEVFNLGTAIEVKKGGRAEASVRLIQPGGGVK